MELVIASQNTHKIHELRNSLKEIAPSLQVLSLFDFPDFVQDAKDSDSFEESAKAKALFAAQALKKVCLADSSGIVVPALSKVGMPAQRRYQHSSKSAICQTKSLLEEIKLFSDIERQAYLECSLALAHPDGTTKSATKRLEGHLAEKESGKITFEFDTIFIKHDYSKTLGELPASVRERISHRRLALEMLLPSILRFVRLPACTTT